MTSLQEHVDELEQQVDVEYVNPALDPTVTVAIVRHRETGAIWLSHSQPDNPENFDADYGRERALYTALVRAVMSRP